jgi:hypothetical protein
MATEWTVESFKEYFTKTIDHLEEKIDSSQSTNSKALELQSVETERRLEALNGEAGRLTKILDASIPREVHERDIKELRALIDVLTLAGTKWVTQDYLAGVLKQPGMDIRDLTSSKDIQTGKSLQNSVNIALIFSIISSIGVVITIVSRFIK